MQYQITHFRMCATQQIFNRHFEDVCLLSAIWVGCVGHVKKIVLNECKLKIFEDKPSGFPLILPDSRCGKVNKASDKSHFNGFHKVVEAF